MLSVENLDVYYGDAQALESITLEIEQGAIVTIVGANGAGKSSLIRTIAGMHKPSRGRIVYRSIDITGWPSYRVCNLGVGQVAEGRQVFPTLTVAENLAMGALLPRAASLRGRIAELREPVRGPVDFAVEHLRQRYPDPERLVIATNYEAHPLMFHLRSRVIVGLAGNNLLEERKLSPDVVIPRGRWPRRLPELERFLARGQWEEVVLPVLDVHYNQIPSLSPSPTTPEPHRFATPRSDDPARGLRVYHRRAPEASGSADPPGP